MIKQIEKYGNNHVMLQYIEIKKKKDYNFLPRITMFTLRSKIHKFHSWIKNSHLGQYLRFFAFLYFYWLNI